MSTGNGQGSKQTGEPVLSVRDLQTHFFLDEGVVKAVDGVSFDVHPGQTVGIVGESGCGKSVTALSILRLVPSPPGRIVGGEILYRGRSLLSFSDPEMRAIRGNEISMVFQEPMTSLNPVYTCGNQIMEAIRLHQKVSKSEARNRAIEMLKLVGIPLPVQRVDEYPHQLSGGMRQRVMIAMALSCNPSVLIADEPTTALDVTIQAQILDLLNRLQEELGMAIILITHDLGVVAEVSDHVVVMYGGKVVEHADVETLFEQTLHPYTGGLLTSIPKLGEEVESLRVIPGVVPNPIDFPSGCTFHPRCHLAIPECTTKEPQLETFNQSHPFRCLRAKDIYEGRLSPFPEEERA
jgi:peptide/nickel transport system ATP-binding protein/oligopeptide transport system ATP-binding protein